MQVSVLMPIHRGQQWMKDAIASVLAQNYRDFELLLGVNGHASEDREFQIAHAAAAQDPRVRVLDCGPAQGYAAAMNTLAQNAGNKWVALIDQDDLWLPEKLLRQIEYLRRYDVVGSLAEYIGEKSGPLDVPVGEIALDRFRVGNPVVNPSAILRCADARWDTSFRGAADYALWVTLSRSGRKFYNVPERLVRHRIHKDSHHNFDPSLREIIIQIRTIACSTPSSSP